MYYKKGTTISAMQIAQVRSQAHFGYFLIHQNAQVDVVNGCDHV